MKRLFLIMFVVILTTNCSPTQQKRVEAPTRYGWDNWDMPLYGDIESVTISEYELKDAFGDITSVGIVDKTYFFNEVGNVTSIITNSDISYISDLQTNFIMIHQVI